MESPAQDVTADETFDLLRDPYPLFARRRSEAGVFKGSVMDWSKTPESMMPEQLYAAVSFDAVNRVFRDGKVFNSHIYDSTIGLFIGPTLIAVLFTLLQAWRMAAEAIPAANSAGQSATAVASHTAGDVPEPAD